MVATGWVLQHPAVHSAIAGFRTVDQLDGPDRARELSIDAAAMARLDEILDINLGRRIGRGVRRWRTAGGGGPQMARTPTVSNRLAYLRTSAVTTTSARSEDFAAS